MKDELAEVKNEIAILARTEQILKSRKDEYDQNMKAIESRKGILGYADTKNNLEKVSEKKGEIDEQKGKTLEQISAIVQNIESNIKAKKNKLAPQMKELKDTREKFKVRLNFINC